MDLDHNRKFKIIGGGGKRATAADPRSGSAPWKILTLFGTRPEIIKLAPVIQQLEAQGPAMQTLNIASGQHTDLLYPFIQFFGVRLDHDLKVMAPHQTVNQVCARVLHALEPILVQERPDLVLVQGDTVTALAGALAGFFFRIPVGHVEAGLRSGHAFNPYPEEMNRRLISRLATYHFAATPRNYETLLAEGVDASQVFITGNPVVDALKRILKQHTSSEGLARLLQATQGMKRIVLTTHRRESFGEVMAGNLIALRRFVEQHPEVVLLFPVHPNPSVRGPATAHLSGHERIHLLEPMDYGDFIHLLTRAWLIVSDSGGIQEEAPTLGKPLLVLRDSTERPEAVEAGVARLVGGNPERLQAMLEEVHQDGIWTEEVGKVKNPFGRGDSGQRIVQVILEVMGDSNKQAAAA